MPYNLRRRYNLRDRQQGRPPTAQKGQRKGQAAEQKHKPRRKGAHRGERRKDNRDNRNTAASSAAAPRGQKQQYTPQPSGNDEMDPWLKEMGFEEVAFFPDPENGLKEGEKPRLLGTTEEEVNPDIFNYGPWPEEYVLHLDPAVRDAAPRNPYIAGLVKAWDAMHAPRD